MFKGSQSEKVCAKTVAHSAVKVGITVESFMVNEISDEAVQKEVSGVESRRVFERTVGDCRENRAHFGKGWLECVNKIFQGVCARRLRSPVRGTTGLWKE